MEELRPNEQRAKTAIILINIILALDFISLISGYLQLKLLKDIEVGVEITTEMANANDTREQVIALVYLITLIISSVTFIRWFRRAYYNLNLKVDHLSHTDGWVAASWFVPFVCLYKPYQIMKELYQETKSLLAQKEINFNLNLDTRWLSIWWAFWIVSGVIGQIMLRYTLQAETIDELIKSTIGGIVSNIVSIPLALLAIKVITDYSHVEPLLHEVNDVEETTSMDEAPLILSNEQPPQA